MLNYGLFCLACLLLINVLCNLVQWHVLSYARIKCFKSTTQSKLKILTTQIYLISLFSFVKNIFFLATYIGFSNNKERYEFLITNGYSEILLSYFSFFSAALCSSTGYFFHRHQSWSDRNWVTFVPC